jgi:hypothetical protein
MAERGLRRLDERIHRSFFRLVEPHHVMTRHAIGIRARRRHRQMQGAERSSVFAALSIDGGACNTSGLIIASIVRNPSRAIIPGPLGDEEG